MKHKIVIYNSGGYRGLSNLTYPLHLEVEDEDCNVDLDNFDIEIDQKYFTTLEDYVKLGELSKGFTYYFYSDEYDIIE